MSQLIWSQLVKTVIDLYKAEQLSLFGPKPQKAPTVIGQGQERAGHKYLKRERSKDDTH